MSKKLLTKVLLTFLAVYTAFLTILTPVAHAQQWYDQSFRDWFVKVYDPNNSQEIFGERYTAAQVQWVIYGFISAIFWPFHGIMYCFASLNFLDCGQKLFQPIVDTLISKAPDQRYYAGRPSTLLGAIFEERPISLITYTKDAARKFHLIPQAEAQAPGFGHQGLQIVQSLWVASRNIVYSLFILVIIILAFMVMFRSKISPQAAITVQSTLPRIVIALVLVTFSYAIAGFLIDLMYVVIGIISLALASSGSFFMSSDPIFVFSWLTKGSMPTLLGTLDLGLPGMMLLYLFLFPIALLFVLFFGGGILQVLVEAAFLPLAGPLGALAIIISIIAGIFFFIIVLLNVFKIIWMLIKTFATILILTIVAPFQIVLGAVAPAGAQGMGFGAWVKAYVAQLAVFPTVGLLITFSFTFLSQSISLVIENFLGSLPDVGLFGLFPSTPAGISVTGWPPLLVVALPAVGRQMQTFLLLCISLIILTITPKAAEMIKSIISGRPFTFGTAIGEGLAPLGLVGAPIGWVGRGISKEAQERVGRYGMESAKQAYTGFRTRLAAGKPDKVVEERLKQVTGGGPGGGGTKRI